MSGVAGAARIGLASPMPRQSTTARAIRCVKPHSHQRRGNPTGEVEKESARAELASVAIVAGGAHEVFERDGAGGEGGKQWGYAALALMVGVVDGAQQPLSSSDAVLRNDIRPINGRCIHQTRFAFSSMSVPHRACDTGQPCL